MRKYLPYLFCFIIITLMTASVWAQDKYKVAIVPFSLHSADNIDYVRQGIEEMLSSRISASDKIEIIGKNAVLDEIKKTNIKDISRDEAYTLGKNLNSDYVVWGSITKIGNSISIDGKLTDVAKNKSDVSLFTQSQSLDDVIPKINDFSQNILQQILGTSAPASTPAAAPAATAPQAQTPMSRESQIIASMRADGKKGGTLTSIINADFINTEDASKRKDFWMSQNIPVEIKGMDIGDVNNDGLNEVVAIAKNTVYIYKKIEDNLVMMDKFKGNSYDNYLAVDVADINKNGIKEIIVTSLNGKLPDSFVMEFKDNKYQKIATDIRMFLRVIDTASGTLLLGQEYGLRKPFETPIHEIIWKDGKYVAGEMMKIPSGFSIYGLAIDDLGLSGGEKIFALDAYDHLYITEKTTKSLARMTSIGFTSEELLWTSDDVYGGSNNYFESIDKNNPEDMEKTAYVNLRILTYDTNKDGKKEMIIVKNISSVGRIFKNFKLFTSSEIYDLEWDRLGLSEKWRTKKINGYVADYAVKDIDNDGKPELVLVLNLNVGLSLKEKSAVVIYKLDSVQ